MKNIQTQKTEPLTPFALTRREAAKMLSISVVSLDRLCKRGLLRPSRALRKPLFMPDELKRFLLETSSELGVKIENPKARGQVNAVIRGEVAQ